jgi:hypothetical protein
MLPECSTLRSRCIPEIEVSASIVAAIRLRGQEITHSLKLVAVGE